MPTYTAQIDGETQTWKDRKRYLWVLGLVVPFLPISAMLRVDSTGWNAFWWMGPFVILIAIPVADAVFRTDRSNPPDWAVDDLAADHWYRWLTYLYLPLQYASFVVGCVLVTTRDLSPLSWLGLTLTVGAVGGIGIANAHELGHKRAKHERWLAKIVLAQTGYGHFVVEHNRGHHVRVATPEDPASARLGETFWEFLPRSVVGGMRSGLELERTRLTRLGQPVVSWRNDVLNAWALSVVLFGATIAWFGLEIVPFLVVQAAFGFSLLEVVNYLEHYGLLRQKRPDGTYEKCTPQHSWNSNHVASNVFLYHLERHSDHHANPLRRYQALRHFDDSPQLPSGYGLMLGLAYIPPLWRRVMDHRVAEHYDGDLTKANIQPGKERQYLGEAATVAA